MKDNPSDSVLFKNIFDASHEGILVVDKKGTIIKANIAGESMFGYDQGELSGKKVEDLIPKKLRRKHVQHRVAFCESPHSRRMGRESDLWGLKKDGLKFPLRVSLSPSVYENETVTIAYIGDTLHSRMVEKELRAKEAKNKALLDALPDMMVIQNYAGDIIDFYAPEQVVVPIPRAELIGRNIKEIVPSEMSKKIFVAHNEAIKTKKIQIREYSLTLNQKKIELESRTVLLNNHNLLTIVRDITDKKRAEQELKESEAKNSAIINALPDTIIVHDKKGNFLDIQTSKLASLIFDREMAIGKNVKDIFPKELSTKIVNVLSKAHETKSLQILEAPIPGRDGIIDCEGRIVPFEENKLLVVLRDITQTKAFRDILYVRNSALEAAGNGIIIVDAKLPDNPIIYCNDAFSQITGFSENEVLGRNCRFLQKNDRDQKELRIIRKAVKEGRPCHEVIRNYKKDGTLFWNELTITPVYDDQGELTHFIGVQNNVTKRIEEALIKDQMRQILEMIATHKPLKKICETIVAVVEGHLSNSVVSIFKLDPKKKTLHKVAAPHLPKGFCDIIEGIPLGPDMAACGAAAYLKKEMIFTDLTTNPLWIDYREAALKYGLNSGWSYPIFSSNKKVLGTFGIYGKEPKKPSKADKDIIDGIIQLISIALEEHHVREQLNKSHWLLEDYARELEKTVNERTNELKATVQKMIEANLNLEDQIKETKDAENRALESQAMFTAIAKNFPKGIIIVFNADFEIVYIDGGEMYRMGLDKSLFEGKCIDDIDIYSKQRIFRIKEDIKKTMGGESLSFETRFRNKYFTVNTSPLRSGNDEIQWTLFVYNNISKQKQAETEIRKALIREQELNELKSRFIAMASHEFRTPLSAIHSSAILIEKQNDAGMEAKREKYVNQIKQNVRGLVVILNDFLSLSKLEEGQVRPNRENIELVAFTKRVVSEMEPNRKRGQRIKVTSNKKSVNAYLDPKLMQHILTNLLSNAIKYSDNDQEILVTLELDNQSTSIRVKDQGIGIPKIEQDKLFQRFFRADNSTNIQGTGLGLNIVKQYTELMGGTVGLESDEDKGSTFWVTFPRIQQPQVSIAEAD
ncbi:MAG: PAS domain S-box protein [Maribacter sp.]|uniref:PAS domain S-box protein n=1 Tax=Maribacter sp. TaxID=1897614 RepID=UPI003C77E429